MDAITLAEFPASLVRDDGLTFTARAVGRRREDGLCEGWLEFLPERLTGAIEVSDLASLQTYRETTQPNETDLRYWASGLTPVYLEGAFRRATSPEVPVAAVT
jgi:hypothetical protein